MVKKKEKEEEEEDNSGTGYEDGQDPFVLFNRAVLRRETNDEITRFHLLVRSQQRSDRRVFS